MKNHLIIFLLLVAALATSNMAGAQSSSHEEVSPLPVSATVSVPISPFLKAKSVIGKGVFSVMDEKGTAKPFFDVIITVKGNAKYRIDAVPLLATTVPKGSSFYFSDGVKQYEFNSLNNRYRIADAPMPDQRPMSQLASMAGLSLVLSPDKTAVPSITRVISEEMLDGKKMVVISDREPPRTTKTGSQSVSLRKAWIDAETGLPARLSDCGETDGVVRTYLQIDYKDWQLNPPIAWDSFVWKKPATAQKEVDDVMPVGTVAPNFKAVTPEGKIVRLSDYKGKIVILDFWATWCGPCQRSLPHLQKLYREVKHKGVTVIALCVWDDRAKYDAWVKTNRNSFTFQTAFDPAGRGVKNIAKTLYKVSNIPTQYLIGRDGKIVAGFTGFEMGDRRLEKALQKMNVAVSPLAMAR